MGKRGLALALAVLMLFGLIACRPAEDEPDLPDEPEDPGTQQGEDVPQTPPGPDPVKIVFQVYDDEEAQWIYMDNGSNKTATGDRFHDESRFIVYRFPTGGNTTARIEITLANQYEVSASADGKKYTVLDSQLTYGGAGVRKTYSLNDFATGKYIYVKIGDAEPEGGWGGLISAGTDVLFAAGNVPVITLKPDYSWERGGVQMRKWNLAPGSEAESMFIVESNSFLKDFGVPFRLCEAKTFVVYEFKGQLGQSAYVRMDLSQEYRVELSSDGEHYDEVMNFVTSGQSRDLRGVDLSPYFKNATSVFMRVSDYIPETGWGAQIRSMEYAEICGAATSGCRFLLNDGWHTSTGDAYCAGELIPVKAGGTVFEREVTLPDCLVEDLAISFACVESGEVAQVSINGKPAELVSSCGNVMTVAIPKDAARKGSFTVSVEVSANADGKAGLWKNVRLGYAGVVSYPEVSRELDGKTVPLTFAYEPYDVVKLNALAGNLLSSLYNKELGINSFDSSVMMQDLYYVGDTARALISVAYEEIYSPVVRLDYAMGIYEMLRGAIVPTSTNRCFLKYDSRPKRAVVSGNTLVWQNTQDVVEPFAGLTIVPDGDEVNDVTTETLTYSEKNFEGESRIRFKGSSRKVDATVNWYDGRSDRATTLAVPYNDKDFRVVISFAGYGKNYESVAVGEERTMINAKDGEIEVSDRYFVLTGQYWHTDGVLITTGVLPKEAYLWRNAAGKIDRLELVFDGESGAQLSLVGISDMDTNLDYAFYLADNILYDGTYGCSGYDPSYICDHSLGGLAAGAYLMKKYNVSGWEEAVTFAANALRDCDTQIERNHYIPDYWESAIAGCDFMVRMDCESATFRRLAGKWADRIVGAQGSDGTYNYLDTRNPVATLLAYDVTGNEKYLNSAKKYLAANHYGTDGVTYKGELYKSLSFTGGGDLVLMTRLGYDADEALAIVRQIEGYDINDTGFFSCSDLNPYFLGKSLAATMNKTYAATEKKTVIRLGQYCLYDADGNVTILASPTSYINNPYNR